MKKNDHIKEIILPPRIQQDYKISNKRPSLLQKTHREQNFQKLVILEVKVSLWKLGV